MTDHVKHHLTMQWWLFGLLYFIRWMKGLVLKETDLPCWWEVNSSTLITVKLPPQVDYQANVLSASVSLWWRVSTWKACFDTLLLGKFKPCQLALFSQQKADKLKAQLCDVFEVFVLLPFFFLIFNITIHTANVTCLTITCKHRQNNYNHTLLYLQ